MASLPSLQAPVLDAGGRFSQAWVGFFTALTKPASAIVPVSVFGSPFTFDAPQNGTVVLTGGAGVGLHLIRGRVSISLDPSGGMIPLDQGDALSVSYSMAPTLFFVPRAV